MIRFAILFLVLFPGFAMAQTGPYAGQDARPIAGLSEGEVAGLRAGAGLGYAKSAELNGYPGPLHVLELATELDLGAETLGQVQMLYDAMQARAIPLGEALIAAEAELDALFLGPAPTPEAIASQTALIARIDGDLRAVHLAAHLETTKLLSRHQRMIYNAERGYGGEHANQGAHGSH